jgi:WD40 repeat protein
VFIVTFCNFSAISRLFYLNEDKSLDSYNELTSEIPQSWTVTKTTKLYTKFKAHDDVCATVLWHPHETSKVASCGWDGVIKYWD